MRKKILFASLCVLSGYFSSAQTVFWSENFNSTATSCSPSSSPFNWSVTEIGAQGSASNYWYIDTTVDCHKPDTCYFPSTSSLNRALYISYGDTCDSALVGPLYKKGCDNTTDKRVESPTINCSGKQNIILQFDYMANQYSYNDYGFVWYSEDNGSTWDSITSRLISGYCPSYGTYTGYWKHYTFLFPSSANNNPNIKIGFRWKNNDDCVGTFVSIAIDNLQLSAGCAEDFYANSDSICPGTCDTFIYSSNNFDSLMWILTGASIDTIIAFDDSTSACYNYPGTYDITLIVFNNGCVDTVQKSNYILVHPFPPPQGITQNNDTLSANQGGAAYQWYFNGTLIPGATNYYYVATSGNYYVIVTDLNGCEVEAVLNNFVYP